MTEPRVSFKALENDPGLVSRMAEEHGSVLVCDGDRPLWRVSHPRPQAPGATKCDLCKVPVTPREPFTLCQRCLMAACTVKDAKGLEAARAEVEQLKVRLATAARHCARNCHACVNTTIELEGGYNVPVRIKSEAEVEAYRERTKELLATRPDDDDHERWQGELFALDWVLGEKVE